MGKFRGELFTVLALPFIAVLLVVVSRVYFEQSAVWSGDPAAISHASMAPIT
jgi:hypothetical protein